MDNHGFSLSEVLKGSKKAYQKRIGKVFFEVLGIRLEKR